ncbi:MAG: YbaN family protein [Acidimicrobiia bacterium]
MKRRAILRWAYTAAGLASIGLAIIGTVLPVVPTVPLVLLAGFFFSRSSERFDRWLVEHSVFGPIITDWRAGLGFTVRAKLVAVVAIVASFGFTLLIAVGSTAGRIGMILLAVSVIVYIVSRPTKRVAAESE